MMVFTKIMLAALGLSAVAIGLMIFIGGPAFTARIFGSVIETIFGVSGYSGGLEHINVDSEMRFFSALWLAYGVYLLWLVGRIYEYTTEVFLALGVFFLGGLGRFISFVAVGTPDLLFNALMYIELGGPIVVATSFAIALRKLD